MSLFIKSLDYMDISCYPGYIVLCHFDLSAWDDALFIHAGIELPTVIQASVSKRRAHYFAGRIAAKSALAKSGITNFPLLNGKNREPLWPKNISGSLSHSASHAVCAVHHSASFSGVGIDIESFLPEETANEIWRSVINDGERDLLHRSTHDFPLMLTLAFSAKESLFKALYPHVRRYFGCDAATLVACDFANNTFTLELTQSLTPGLSAGEKYTGYFQFIKNEIMTFIYFG